jgi:hypothetical protein
MCWLYKLLRACEGNNELLCYIVSGAENKTNLLLMLLNVEFSNLSSADTRYYDEAYCKIIWANGFREMASGCKLCNF